VRFSPDGSRLAVASSDNFVDVFDARRFEEAQILWSRKPRLATVMRLVATCRVTSPLLLCLTPPPPLSGPLLVRAGGRLVLQRRISPILLRRQRAAPLYLFTPPPPPLVMSQGDAETGRRVPSVRVRDEEWLTFTNPFGWHVSGPPPPLTAQGFDAGRNLAERRRRDGRKRGLCGTGGGLAFDRR
jgi:hypothetical protein